MERNSKKHYEISHIPDDSSGLITDFFGLEGTLAKHSHQIAYVKRNENSEICLPT